MNDETEKKVAELAAATAALPFADPVNRARAAKELIDRAKATYSRVRRDSIVEALAAGRTYQELADELGVSTAAINAAVSAVGRNASLHVSLRQVTSLRALDELAAGGDSQEGSSDREHR
jgi:hypothetical protein